jgi:hypothetical protein
MVLSQAGNRGLYGGCVRATLSGKRQNYDISGVKIDCKVSFNSCRGYLTFCLTVISG